MSKPVCLITGTTHGIGRVTALRLLERGYHLVMGCRDLARAEQTRRELAEQSGNPDIEVLHCDLASLDSVRACAASFRNRFDSLELLVNNAGLMTTRYQQSAEGLELTFAANYLGPYLLTRSLLDKLKAAERSRIVNVASRVHYSGVLDLELLDAERKNGMDQSFSGMRAYGRSKLGNVMFTLSLAERLAGTDVTANCLHPGVVATNITAATNTFLRVGMKLAAPFMFNEERGARTTLYLALDPAVEGVSGRYFDERQRQQQPAAAALDRNQREALWRWSGALCDADANITGAPGERR